MNMTDYAQIQIQYEHDFVLFIQYDSDMIKIKFITQTLI